EKENKIIVKYMERRFQNIEVMFKEVSIENKKLLEEKNHYKLKYDRTIESFMNANDKNEREGLFFKEQVNNAKLKVVIEEYEIK
ncbi:hypothetical protein HA388_29555, partial [Escherichia coli]|nr:hypothetical protein [Escherichia coli]